MGTASNSMTVKLIPLTAREKREEQARETQRAMKDERTAANRGLGLHHKKKDTEGDRAKFEEEIIMLFARLCTAGKDISKIEKEISKLKEDAGELCTSYFHGKCDFQ